MDPPYVPTYCFKGRLGFESESLGDLNSYFEKRFSEEKLRNYVEPVIPDMLEVGDSVVKRHRLFNFVENIQEKVFVSVIQDLRNS